MYVFTHNTYSAQIYCQSQQMSKLAVAHTLLYIFGFSGFSFTGPKDSITLLMAMQAMYLIHIA
jgi:hypothetical protein